jgi:hypothetical protein
MMTFSDWPDVIGAGLAGWKGASWCPGWARSGRLEPTCRETIHFSKKNAQNTFFGRKVKKMRDFALAGDYSLPVDCRMRNTLVGWQHGCRLNEASSIESVALMVTMHNLFRHQFVGGAPTPCAAESVSS